MRIVVTGHQGYVGPVFAKHVAGECPNWELTGIDAGFFRGQLAGADPSSLFVREIQADVRDLPKSVLEGCDAVIQLAAVSNDPMGKEFEDATYDINASAAVRMAKMCREARIGHYVYASSCSMYGAGSDAPRAELDELNPLTAYARAKVEAEEQLRPLADDDFRVTCLRFATACGASPRLRLDLVLNDFVASAIQTGRIEVLSDGTPWRPLIHTEDMARAIQWALEREGAPFLAINVGSNAWTWQIGDLARDVADILGDVDVSINAEAQRDLRSYRVDFSLFEKLAPDYQPQKAFNEAVLELKDQVKTMEFNGRPFRESPYIRLNVLRDLIASKRLSSDLCWKRQSSS